MRGTLESYEHEWCAFGIIPAHAGNTLSASTAFRTRRDHPRACGERFQSVRRWRTYQGSSPRMRGTRNSKEIRRCCKGIIPAHAGNTERTGWSRCACVDHPRACGEHLVGEVLLDVSQGSSPRMRGTHPARCRCSTDSGIIPAHAGNTCRFTGMCAVGRDHPRACGEHSS